MAQDWLQPISVAQARSNLSDLLGQVYYGGKRFVIEKIGKPLAILINIEEYERFLQARTYFFKRIEITQSKNKLIPFPQVKQDVAAAIKAVRSNKR